MKTKDNLHTFLKELPIEAPPESFTSLVMERIWLEAVKSPVVYTPLISSKGWWKIIFGSIVLSLVMLLLYEFFPVKESSGFVLSLSSADFSFLLKPFELLSKFLSGLSFTYVAVVVSVSLLLVVDQLYGRLAKQ